MPDMDGIETARQIRKRIGKEITIIVLTSYEFSEIEEEAKAAGIDAFIAKPLFRSRLTATLRQFTSGRKEKTARNYLEKLSAVSYTHLDVYKRQGLRWQNFTKRFPINEKTFCISSQDR